ncbi:E3 SUMO-protein ligase ZBED1-like [Rhopalosiphum padi]|uniref:E3 SUMO-protein ligase ZBED1-like n=1 Tax=Rhopalosiphum padi TaxID=40932 RepID=UPI00298DC123|nr:E3 SUMO-protein ligase ZBED1-like [Rhopalosiphum padi]
MPLTRKRVRGLKEEKQDIDEPDCTISAESTIFRPSTSTYIKTNKIRNSIPQNIQTKIDSFVSKPISLTKSKQIDNQLAIVIAKEFQPYSLVENKEFKKFVKLLNPGYTLPSRKTISKCIIPQLVERIKQKIKVNIKNAEHIAFTTDESHTAVNLSDFMNKCFIEWEIQEKIKVAVSDNAANIVAAINLNTKWRHLPCLAHSINLIAQSGLGEISEVHKKVKSVVEFFKRSSQAYTKLKNTQIQMGYPTLKLIQDVATRWNSTYAMFQRCIDLKEPLVSTIAVMGNPFNEVIIELSSEKEISISKVLILVNMLISHLKIKKQEKDLPQNIYHMVEKMESKADRKFQNINMQRILTEATILDPRFKKKGFNSITSYQQAYQKLILGVTSITSNQTLQTSNDNVTMTTEPENCRPEKTLEIWKDFDAQVTTTTTITTPRAQAILEIDRYMNEPLLSRKLDPLI